MGKLHVQTFKVQSHEEIMEELTFKFSFTTPEIILPITCYLQVCKRHTDSLFSLSRSQFGPCLFKCLLYCPPLAYYSSEITCGILTAIQDC